MKIRFAWTDTVNVLCVTVSYINTELVVPDERIDEVIDRYVRIPESTKKFGDFAVFMNQPNILLDRAYTAAKKAKYELSYDFVDYSGRMPNPKTDERIFCKGSEYKHEREFRLAFFSPQKVERPLTLETGDLSDIARLVRTQEITGTRMTVYARTRGPGQGNAGSLGVEGRPLEAMALLQGGRLQVLGAVAVEQEEVRAWRLFWHWRAW